jgi:hypothetical protein
MTNTPQQAARYQESQPPRTTQQAPLSLSTIDAESGANCIFLSIFLLLKLAYRHLHSFTSKRDSISFSYLLRPGKAYTDYTEKSRLHGFLKYIIRCFRLFSVFRCTKSEIGLSKYSFSFNSFTQSSPSPTSWGKPTCQTKLLCSVFFASFRVPFVLPSQYHAGAGFVESGDLPYTPLGIHFAPSSREGISPISGLILLQ